MLTTPSGPNSPEQSEGGLTPSQRSDFLGAVGIARRYLLGLHRYLTEQSSKQASGESMDQETIERLIGSAVMKITGLLEQWDRKPVFGRGVQLKIANEVLGLCAGENSAQIMLEQVREGKLTSTIADIRSVENRLHQIYQSVSGDDASMPFITDRRVAEPALKLPPRPL